jgi:hypothetical protein
VVRGFFAAGSGFSLVKSTQIAAGGRCLFALAAGLGGSSVVIVKLKGNLSKLIRLNRARFHFSETTKKKTRCALGELRLGLHWSRHGSRSGRHNGRRDVRRSVCRDVGRHYVRCRNGRWNMNRNENWRRYHRSIARTEHFYTRRCKDASNDNRRQQEYPCGEPQQVPETTGGGRASGRRFIGRGFQSGPVHVVERIIVGRTHLVCSLSWRDSVLMRARRKK